MVLYERPFQSTFSLPFLFLRSATPVIVVSTVDSIIVDDLSFKLGADKVLPPFADGEKGEKEKFSVVRS